jgi:RNA methyltransferase, TrmH family
MFIESARNPRIQHLQKLIRQRKERLAEGLFVAEGLRAVSQFLDNGIEPVTLYRPEGQEQALAKRIERAGAEDIELGAGALARVGDTANSSGVLLVAKRPRPPRQLPSGTSFVLIAHQISDPGNLGAIVRTAVAAGVEAVIVTSGSTDPWGPKVVRSSVGSLCAVPIVEMPFDAAIEECSRADMEVIAAGLSGDASGYDDLDLTNAVALAVGNEAHGLDPEALALVDHIVQIPMAQGVESLNVAASVAVLCFEVARQRRAA